MRQVSSTSISALGNAAMASVAGDAGAEQLRVDELRQQLGRQSAFLLGDGREGFREAGTLPGGVEQLFGRRHRFNFFTGQPAVKACGGPARRAAPRR